jgi:hypothetical protein
MPRNPNIEPKPFALIPIPTQAPDRKPVVTHEKFTGLTGRLELSFTVASEYLFVGSGAYEFDPNARGDRPDVWYTFYRRNGKLCVPGTSIKGAIRAIVEAISNSCVSQIRRFKEQVQSQQHQPCRFEDEKSPSALLAGFSGQPGKQATEDGCIFQTFCLNRMSGPTSSKLANFGSQGDMTPPNVVFTSVNVFNPWAILDHNLDFDLWRRCPGVRSFEEL